MADKKISQLTSAATPLAGTEVLPIVQSGSTVKVSSDDLTVKNVRSNATTGILQVAGPGTGTTRVMTTPNANFTVLYDAGPLGTPLSGALQNCTSTTLSANDNSTKLATTAYVDAGLSNKLNKVSSFNLLTQYGVNEKCYATTGWTFSVLFGGGSSLATDTAAPTNYPPKSLLVTVTGASELRAYDGTSTATVQNTAIRVSPGDVFTYSFYASDSIVGNSSVYLRYFDSTGTFLSNSAAVTTSGSATWALKTNTVTAPSLAAYAALVFYLEVTTINVCDAKVYLVT